MDVPLLPLVDPPVEADAAPVSVPIQRRDPDDPAWRSIELVQRGRMILDVSRADLDEAEARLGPFHATTWHFRNALDEAKRSWDRLRAAYGTRALEAALASPPLATMALTTGQGRLATVAATLILIGGKTYSVERVPGTTPAPLQYRLTRLPTAPNGPYYACRLHDGSVQCDCAEWVYQVADNPDAPLCKHLAALDALGWL